MRRRWRLLILAVAAVPFVYEAAQNLKATAEEGPLPEWVRSI